MAELFVGDVGMK